MDLSEIEAKLRSSDELQLQIVTGLGSFGVALFAVSGSKSGEVLQLAGSGTLFSAGGVSYILTAAHVWEKIIKPAAKMGITLTDRIDHQFLIDVKAIAAFGPANPVNWNEWGPDLVFLRIPPEHLGSINAYKVFYSPLIDAKSPPAVNHLETWVIMGAPEELGTFTQTHADIKINGLFLGDPAYREHEDFDYIDFSVDTSGADSPKSFGGVSGGGLWKVFIYSSPAGKIEWGRSLEGVAFWQTSLNNAYRTIRSHGPKSITSSTPKE